MAKQVGVIGFRGKIKNQSFYSSKNGGELVRTINEGMSARVKTAKEYANTRKNNSEFGMCGDFAGAIIKPISLRWRFILDSIATGMMVKELKKIVALDTTDIWGQRTVQQAYFDQIAEKLNSFSKNEMLDEIKNTLLNDVEYFSETTAIEISNTMPLTVSRQQELIAEGVNHVQVRFFGLKAGVPMFDATANVYGKSESSLIPISNMNTDVDLTATAPVQLAASQTGLADLSDVISGDAFGGLLVVYLPCRKIGGSVSVLQEKCSAYLAKVISGD